MIGLKTTKTLHGLLISKYHQQDFDFEFFFFCILNRFLTTCMPRPLYIPNTPVETFGLFSVAILGSASEIGAACFVRFGSALISLGHGLTEHRNRIGVWFRSTFC